MEDDMKLLKTILTLSIIAVSQTAMAQAWPNKPITVVVSYPAGGDTDVIMRVYAEKLSARLGQPIIVENKPGASGTIGNSFVAKAAPDGYTFLFTPSTFAVAQHVLKVASNVAHDVNNDFTPVIKSGNIPLLAVTSPTSGIKDMKQLIAESKGGKTFTYASPGAGSPMHILGEMLNKEAGIKMNHVAYRGVAPLIPDVVGNHVSIGWVTPGAVATYLSSGRLIPLATGEKNRSASVPTTPTLMEMGYKNLDVSAWMALLGPKGLSPDIVRVVNGHMNDILKMPDVKARMDTMGIEPIGGAPAVLAKQVADDDTLFGRIVKEFGIKAE
jgi:tripartite-type tricarboxylate transporter receptor subunit TctC